MPKGPDQSKPTPPSSANQAARAATDIGFEFAAAVAAFAVGGYFVDRWLETSPTWTLIGTALGFIGGGYNLFKAVRRIQSADARDKATTKAARESRAKTPSPKPTPAPTGKVKPGRADERSGMFARAQFSDDDLEDIDDIKWPADAAQDDTPREDPPPA